MSFILDALRKSDQLRQRGAAPTLLTAQAVAAEPKKPAYWIHGLLAAVVLAAGIAIGWLRPWQPAPPVAAVQPVAPAPGHLPGPTPLPAAPGPTPAAPPAGSLPLPDAPAPKPAAIATPAPPAAADTPGSSARSPSDPEARATPFTQPGATVRGQAAAPSDRQTGAAGSAPRAKVLALGELPAAIRQEIPPMQVLLHQYSSRPRNRFVTINNQTLQEGDLVAPGITLEQITPDGMILSYQGYRFRRGVQ